MSKFKIGDKVIVSRYGKPSVKGTVVRVPDGLIEIFYRVRLEDGNYLNSIESYMISAEIEKYFYCPVCRQKSLIKDAVIKRHILNKSIRLDNAAMPGWMKISASAESCYIRVCPDCEAKKLPNDAFIKAYDGNAIENREDKIRAAENSASGCMVLMGTIITAISTACWILCMII